jgi:transposase InsO family protein
LRTSRQKWLADAKLRSAIQRLGNGKKPCFASALHDRQPERPESVFHHSDRVSQYVSIRYTERLAEAGIELSVGSRGDSYGNALAETINNLYKTELIHRRAPWKTRESVVLATLK